MDQEEFNRLFQNAIEQSQVNMNTGGFCHGSKYMRQIYWLLKRVARYLSSGVPGVFTSGPNSKVIGE